MDGSYLRNRIKELGFDQASIAESLNISPQAFNSKLQAKDLKFSFIKSVAKAINKSVYYLLEEESDHSKNDIALIEPKVSYEVPKTVTVDYQGQDNIVMVPIPAQAGYLNGLGDPEYIESLPAYRLPGLNNGTFRMFEVKGHSMYPTIHAGAIAVGEWCENWADDIKDNRIYIIVSKDDGIVIKRCLNRIKKYGNLFLKSDNRAEYPSYPIDLDSVLEVWELKTALIWNFQDPADLYDRVTDMEAKILQLETKLVDKK